MRDEYLKQIGEEIRNLRKNLNLSQRYCAAKMGISHQSWSKYERGKEKGAGYAKIRQMLDFLGGESPGADRREKKRENGHENECCYQGKMKE